jgi:hypothetical protein
MAWSFRIDGKRVGTNGVNVGVEYFDTDDPKKVLARQSFTFEPGETRADAVTKIRTHGRQLKAARDQAQALADSFTVNEPAAIN